jgi:hypothetical protein
MPKNKQVEWPPSTTMLDWLSSRMKRHCILLLAAFAALLPCHAWAETNAAKPSSGDDILVGVHYFAGWWRELPNKWHGQGWRIGQPDWRPDFPERVPTLGEYNEQATMDREIIAASEHGVDYFAILYYYPKPGTNETKHAPSLNRGLEQFIASPEAHVKAFCVVPSFLGRPSVMHGMSSEKEASSPRAKAPAP